ncbi:hypothetical protein SAMN04489740_0858 [Arthrobacter alpinus]|uniref:Uncharacterized protein n=1 Tax=Arthrobacter alpinus TaxID=656366 RepID=A0A1H5GV44_9MICC|nr:hypothetical protein [Arthrobacter alpinus]SEE19599.1 hypothetical protein SAMN04489740_0858 [Arthrobacter alpinus]
MDLAEWYVAGRWTALLELIDMLPSNNRLNEAIANDPESARQLAEMSLDKDPDDEPWSPKLSEFGITEHLLREILHAIKLSGNTAIAAAGGKPGEIKPFPAPRTGIDRALEAAERDWAVGFAGLFGFDASDI